MGIVFSSGKAKELVPFLSKINSTTMLISGAVIVAIGIVFLFMSNKSSSKTMYELPIYEGKGKKRKVVGYQRE